MKEALYDFIELLVSPIAASLVSAKDTFQDDVDGVVDKMVGIPNVIWPLQYSLMRSWLEEFQHIPSSSFKQITCVLPSLHARIQTLIGDNTSTPSGDDNDEDADDNYAECMTAPSQRQVGKAPNVGDILIKSDYQCDRCTPNHECFVKEGKPKFNSRCSRCIDQKKGCSWALARTRAKEDKADVLMTQPRADTTETKDATASPSKAGSLKTRSLKRKKPDDVPTPLPAPPNRAEVILYRPRVKPSRKLSTAPLTRGPSPAFTMVDLSTPFSSGAASDVGPPVSSLGASSSSSFVLQSQTLEITILRNQLEAAHNIIKRY